MESKIACLDRLIDEYSLLILDANDRDKKSYEIFVESLVAQKVKIQETMEFILILR